VFKHRLFGAAICYLIFLSGAAQAKEVTIIAHRGDSGHAPENTLAAFRQAVAAKADYFELDCHLTKDGQVIISHDGDLEKTTGKKVNIADLTLAELAAYDVGTWFDPKFAGERLPTLAQSLDVATRRCGVYVEIKSQAGDGKASQALVKRAAGEKALTSALRQELLAMADAAKTRSPELTRACIREIRAKHLEKRAVIQSFSPLICFVALCEAPEIRTELLISEDEDNPEHFPRLVDFGMLIGVKGFNANKDSLSAERLATFQKAGKSVAVWTINEPAEWEKFRAMGVDAIITNFPGECRAAGKR
jgi:glycerophosphoryl diester phosphodiesterase